MGSIFQLIMTVAATILVLTWIFLSRYYGEKFEDLIQTIDPEEYRYPELFGAGFGLMELVRFDMNSERSIAKIKKISEIKGKKYAPYYYYVMTGQKVSYAATIIPFVILLAALANSVEALLFGTVITVLLLWYINELTQDKLQERRDELIKDFPSVLSKLALLVNSGMMLREAWRTVSSNGEGLIYREMRLTIEEMNQGISEMEAYQNFAERCEVKEIKRFASSVTQNMLKGNAELAKVLKEMSDEMWNEKKNLVKRQGEAADSKLLIPTVLIFAAVLIVIMVPMFTSL